MFYKENPQLLTNAASLVLVGEITHTLRAKGNVRASGIEIGSDVDSPVVDGIYKSIPQAQIGLMTHADFINMSDGFLEAGSGVQTPWNLVGAVSLDAVFYPYTTQMDSGRSGPYLPRWTKPTEGNSATSYTLNPFNPFNQMTGVRPTGWMKDGHNISMALNYNPYDSGIGGNGGFVGATGIYPNGSGSPVDFYFEKDHFSRHTVETDSIRSVGLKSPIVLTGWGFDVDGEPVPSSGDSFHPEASYNPKLWKSGPVDLRWDEDRGVWTGGGVVHLVKLTNLYTPPSFSFEVDRSNTRDQYSRNAPTTRGAFSSGLSPIYDPEYVAYHANANNKGYYEQLDYNNVEYPYYEAFIIRSTSDDPVTASDYYNIWTNDCQDCGHITKPCGGGASHGSSIARKKILIENPLRQSFDVGDLAFTVNTGRKKNVNTGKFIGGSGSGASGNIVVDSGGIATFTVTNSGIGYTTGGFALAVGTDCDICVNVSLIFTGDVLTSGTITPSGGHIPSGGNPSGICAVTIYPNNATVETQKLPIHWVTQAEFKSQQVVTHVECDNGILQTCTLKIQTQGYKTCEWCGEDTALIN